MDDTEAGAIEQELRDRFGQLPPAARNLVWIVRLRIMATKAGIGAIQTEDGSLVIRMLPGLALDRAAAAKRMPPGSNVLNHQVRLNRDTLGETWRESLVRALDAIMPATAAATVTA
jgi:transcription-repair coupling factor (superfamily II helicase)